MIVKIGAIVRQVALIALLAAFLEMLLPEKKMTRYVRLVLGLFVVVAILSPLVEGLRTGPELDVAAWDLRLDPVTAAPVQQGREMAAANDEAALEIYRERLAGQIKALLGLIPGIQQVEVLVQVAGKEGYRGAIERIIVTATLGTGTTPAASKGMAGAGPSPVNISPIEVKPGATDGIPYQPAPAGGDQRQEQPGLKTGPGAQTGNQEHTTQGNKDQPAPAPQSPGRGESSPANPPSTSGKLQKPGGGAAKPPGNTVPSGEQIKARIREMVCHFYGLEPGQVEVIILAGNATGKAPSGGGDSNGAP
ncbi:stage III sporulation protein AF [Moorella naiadis]|uniref:stage III sporulation protein AF n=1 Tax=Moorella naiadis (nom. illeg.) TaxID=3093670 RepID=UPI003D9C8BA8